VSAGWGVSGIDYGRRWSEQQAWRRSASLFVAPVILLARLLLIGAGGFLQVVALDADTGSTVWWDEASTALTTPGVPPELAVVGGDVVYMRAIDGGAELVARDAAGAVSSGTVASPKKP
jgi:hypothetical protein